MDLSQQLLDVGRRTFRLLKGSLCDGGDLVQFALERAGGWLLLLRFQEQLRVSKDAFARLAFGIAPGVVERGGLPGGPSLAGENGRHPEALFDAHSRHWHEVAHGDLGGDLAFAHLLLDGLRQRLD